MEASGITTRLVGETLHTRRKEGKLVGLVCSAEQNLIAFTNRAIGEDNSVGFRDVLDSRHAFRGVSVDDVEVVGCLGGLD